MNKRLYITETDHVIGTTFTDKIEIEDILLVQDSDGESHRLGVVKQVGDGVVITDKGVIKVHDHINPNHVSVRNLYTTGAGDLMIMNEPNSRGDARAFFINGEEVVVNINDLFEL